MISRDLKISCLSSVGGYFLNQNIIYNRLKVYSSSDIGPVHKAPPPVATQLVVPTELSESPVNYPLSFV